MMCGIAAFSALAFCVALVTNIPVAFLTFDAKDAVITIASFIYGPVSAVIMSVITALLEFATVGKYALYGLIMDIISTTAFTVTASLIYKYRRRLSGAIISLGSACAAYVGVMLCANLLVTPHFMGASVEYVAAMIPTLLLPFNLAKALMNSAIVILLYKPISRLSRRFGFSIRESAGSNAESGQRRDTIIMLGIATAAFALALVMFIILM